MQPLMETHLPLPNRRTGKVRDIYDLQLGSEQAVLMVATDRISAYDVVMANGVPGRGRLLTSMAAFWFKKLAAILPNHLLSCSVADVPGLCGADRDLLQGRVMLCKSTSVIPIECIVRAYLAGSGWKDYVATGEVGGIRLPPGLAPSARLPEPIFTPSSKAEVGHDENISYAAAAEQLGESLMAELRDHSLAIHQYASSHAAERGLLIADTKMEFGRLPNGEVILIDEVLTPDSSRFWPAKDYRPGSRQPDFDKQYLRNYLSDEIAAGRWDGKPPGPELPKEVCRTLFSRYEEVFLRLQ